IYYFSTAIWHMENGGSMIRKSAFRLAILSLALIGGGVRTLFGQKPPAKAPTQAVDLQPGGRDFNDLVSRIQMKLIGLRDASNYPGVNVGIALPDGRLMSVSVGYSDLKAERPLKPADRMLAGGGIGNTFVSAVTLQLVEEGKLDL